MPPKKRKIEAETKDEASSPLEVADIEVKKERLSQEDDKDTPQPAVGKSGAVRNLRPRKSTCYAEKDSPEINYEEKLKKASRRKRRPVSSEDGPEEKETKIKRTENVDGEAVKTSSQNADDSPESEKTEPALPTLVSCSVLNSENPIVEKLAEKIDTKPEGTADEVKQQQKKPERKRPKKKPKPKPIQSEVLPLDPDIVPKTEPLSPSAIPENKDNAEEIPDESKPVDSDPVKVTAKPKPRKRIRNKKPAVVPAVTNEDGKPIDETVIKLEVDENGEVVPGVNEKSAPDNTKEGNDEEEKAAAPKKKPAKKRSKPKVKKDPLDTDPDKIGEKTSGGDDCESSKSENVIKTETNAKSDETGIPKAVTTVRKRVKSRPKKPAASTKSASCDGEGESKQVNSTEDEHGEDKKKLSENDGNGTKEPVKRAAAPAVRKPFFRGRRSKSISARSGRKEIIHQEEAIDPEDIRGFEHVEKFVTPPGVRLPKFWDSEDEMSEDENNDNFRRIMCGFGTNCRIHEVIRPASEIVRRLKELQNTFGATKSLPLFQKDELGSKEEEASVPADLFFRKDRDRSITWHTDPSFFKYANNYPSKCK